MRHPRMTRPGLWVDLGARDYADTYALQLELVALRRRGLVPDTLLVVEHPPCLTLGRGALAEHVLSTDEVLALAGIGIYQTDRGGGVTYHGPGQLVCYPIVDLNDYGRDVHEHLRRLERLLIRTAADLGLKAWRRPGYPGAWTGQGKLGAVGVAVRRWVTLHGVSLNVSPDLAHFAHIVPCGLSDRRVTSLQEALGVEVHVDDVRPVMRACCQEVFGLACHDLSSERLAERGFAANAWLAGTAGGDYAEAGRRGGISCLTRQKAVASVCS